MSISSSKNGVGGLGFTFVDVGVFAFGSMTGASREVSTEILALFRDDLGEAATFGGCGRRGGGCGNSGGLDRGAIRRDACCGTGRRQFEQRTLSGQMILAGTGSAGGGSIGCDDVEGRWAGWQVLDDSSDGLL